MKRLAILAAGGLCLWILVASQPFGSAALVPAGLTPMVFLPYVAGPPCSNPSTQVLADTSFEDSPSAWTVVLGDPTRSASYARTGAYSMLFGGHDGATDVISQTVTVPPWAETAVLSYSWRMYSNDSESYVSDFMSPTVVYGGVGLASQVINNTSSRAAWYSARLPLNNIADYRGQTLRVTFVAITSGFYPTWWYVDDVELWFGCGAGSPRRVPASD